jgi:hypothetical protein
MLMTHTRPHLLEVRDNAGWSALDIALFHNRAEAAAVLEDAGAVRSAFPPPHKQQGAVGHRIDGGNSHGNDGTPDQFSGGGWLPDTEEAADISPRCDIDERTNITAEEFYLHYQLPGKPVILRGAAKDWAIRQASAPY